MDLFTQIYQKLTISNKILKHVNSKLQKILIIKQKHQKRSKKINLIKKNELKHCIFFPTKIVETQIH